MSDRILLAIHTDCCSMNAEDEEAGNQNDARNENNEE